jgi:hypothetical protein
MGYRILYSVTMDHNLTVLNSENLPLCGNSNTKHRHNYIRKAMGKCLNSNPLWLSNLCPNISLDILQPLTMDDLVFRETLEFPSVVSFRKYDMFHISVWNPSLVCNDILWCSRWTHCTKWFDIQRRKSCNTDIFEIRYDQTYSLFSYRSRRLFT